MRWRNQVAARRGGAAAVRRGASLRECIAFANAHDVPHTYRPKTGEYVFGAPRDGPVLAVNGRRKDVPIKLIKYLNHYQERRARCPA